MADLHDLQGANEGACVDSLCWHVKMYASGIAAVEKASRDDVMSMSMQWSLRETAVLGRALAGDLDRSQSEV